MLTRILGSAVSASPALKRTLWRKWYQFLARGYRQTDWTFMNYGYADGANASGKSLFLEAADEPDRCSIQLYHAVVAAVEIQGRKVLEVGSGRGGGCSYIARYLLPERIVGVDYSPNAVALSRERHAAVAPRLEFQQGDAEALPCDADAFDVVVNVESSHCYGSMERFLGEVRRVLRPNGYFVWADMRPRGQWEATLAQFRNAGLEMREEAIITPNVLLALDAVSDRKQEAIRRQVPKYLLAWFQDFAGVRGTRVYEALRSGEVEYRRCVLQKPAAATTL